MTLLPVRQRMLKTSGNRLHPTILISQAQVLMLVSCVRPGIALRLITAALTAKSSLSLHLPPLQTDPLLTGHYCQHHQVHDAGSSSSGTYKHCASVRQEPRPGGQRVREQSLPFTRYPSDPPVCRCPGSNSDGDGVRCCLALKDALHHPYAHPYHHCGCAGVSVQGTTQESFLKTMIRDLVSVARRWKARYGTLTSPSCDALRLRSKHMRDDLLRISGTPHLRSQALDLRKTEAARFGASIHEVRWRFPSKPSLKLNVSFVWHSV